MLSLLTPTDPDWLKAAEGQLPALLSDHAHCEIKAAQNALAVVARFGGELPQLVAPLTALAHEETEHFGMVHARISQRGELLGLPSSDSYVTQLSKAARGTRPEAGPALLDKLVVCALIEGRSCERFRILSEGLADADLRAFYRDLMASEARHFTLFTQLASDCFGKLATRERLAQLAQREADIVKALPQGPQVHG
jgi:tRNA-(ms[2]io[6]A)-hydroxylase